MEPNYPWYAEVTDGSLDQGDMLPQCPAGYLPLDWDPEMAEQPYEVTTYDLVVITQACDLAHEKTDYVVCCPVSPHTQLDEDLSGQSRKSINALKDKVRQGLVPGYAMIAAYDGDPAIPVSIVDFRHVFSLPKSFLLSIAEGKHLRLLPPYREHVSQAFARFFMRVGLPVGVPPFRQ